MCILQNQQEEGGGSQKIELLARGANKISSFEPQYVHFPLVTLNELSLNEGHKIRGGLKLEQKLSFQNELQPHKTDYSFYW